MFWELDTELQVATWNMSEGIIIPLALYPAKKNHKELNEEYNYSPTING
jgi:hypothetical protein